MRTIKETTLHPDGNEGVDLYPKTNINQVEGLKGKIEIYDNYQERIINLETGKLNKPVTPTVDSVVTMLTNGTSGTKPLSEIGGGGKLYLHLVSVEDQRDMKGIVMSFYTSSNIAFTPTTFKEYFRQYYNFSGITGVGNHENNKYPSYAYVDTFSGSGHDNDVITYYTQGNGASGEVTLVLSEFIDSYGSFSDTVTEV